MESKKSDTTTMLVFDVKKNKLTQFRNNGQPLGGQWYIIATTSEFLADCFCDLWNLLLHKDIHTKSSIKNEYNKFITITYVFRQRTNIYTGCNKEI